MNSNEITIKQIELFLAVAEEESIAGASKRLHLDPAGVSRWISRLESYFQFKLFYRTKHGVKLTEAGAQLYTSLKPLVQSFHSTIGYYRSVYSPVHNALRIGIMNSPELWSAYNEIIPVFQKKHPSVIVNSEPIEMRSLQEDLAISHFDCIIGYSLGFGSYEGFESLEIRPFDSYILLSSRHPALKTPVLNASLLNGEIVYRLFSTDLQSSEQNIRKLLNANNIFPSEFRYVSNSGILQQLIRNNEGITVSSKDMFKDCWPEIVPYKLNADNQNRQQMILVWDKNRTTEDLKSIIHFLKSYRISQY